MIIFINASPTCLPSFRKGHKGALLLKLLNKHCHGRYSLFYQKVYYSRPFGDEFGDIEHFTNWPKPDQLVVDNFSADLNAIMGEQSEGLGLKLLITDSNCLPLAHPVFNLIYINPALLSDLTISNLVMSLAMLDGMV